MLLCVGNFFGINNSQFEEYRTGVKNVPIPTYILGPSKEEHTDLYPKNESEICPNVYYLGKCIHKYYYIQGNIIEYFRQTWFI